MWNRSQIGKTTRKKGGKLEWCVNVLDIWFSNKWEALILFHKWKAYIFANYTDRSRKSYHTLKAFCTEASQNLGCGKDLFINVVLVTAETTLISKITYIDTSYNCSCLWYKALSTTVTIGFEIDKWMPVGYYISWPSFREVSLSKTGSSAVSCVTGG